MASVREYWTALRLHDPDAFAALSAEYRATHGQEIKKACAAYYRLHKKEARQRTRDWRAKNRERYNAYQRSYYAKKKKEKA